MGDIGLPDIQRPFVWKWSKVRDLLDSMYRGYPVGYLLFWTNEDVQGTRQIGTGAKQHKVPKMLVVDGQQRLTSLFAVFKGHTVLDEEFGQVRVDLSSPGRQVRGDGRRHPEGPRVHSRRPTRAARMHSTSAISGSAGR